jgi:hypothetical protein
MTVVVCVDTVERFHIMAHLLFVLAQNIQNSEDFWLWNFAYVCVPITLSGTLDFSIWLRSLW